MPRPNERWLFSLRPDVERVGILERGRIPVCRAEQCDRLLARTHALAAHLQVLADDAPVELDGAVVAQQLVDGRLQQAGIVPEALQLIRMAEQRQHAVADQITRGLVARYQDQQHGGQQLLAGQPVAFLLGRQQGANNVVPRLSPPFLHDGLEVGEQLLAGTSNVLDLRGREDRLDDERDVVGPALETVHVLCRHAQHLGDHRHRQRVAEGGDQVDTIMAGDRIQKPVGDLLHAIVPSATPSAA